MKTMVEIWKSMDKNERVEYVMSTVCFVGAGFFMYVMSWIFC